MKHKLYANILLFTTTISFATTCVRLKAPPITFTQTATAAEKQMLGEDKDIENDGWILASIRTSATGSKVWKREVLDRTIDYPDYDDEVFSALRKLSYFSGEVYEFKKKGFIGESLSGELKINPNHRASLYYQEYPAKEKRIEFILVEINRTRDYIRSRKIASIQDDKTLSNADKETKILELKKAFYRTVEKGEFFEEKPGEWKIRQ